MALPRRSDRFGLSVYAPTAPILLPQTQRMRMPFTTHTALTPFSANWPPDRDHGSIRRQRFRVFAIHPYTQFSHHTDNHRIKASRALDHRTVWHGLRAITTHPSTRRCDQCLSLEWNNNPSLRRSMLRAVTFDARFQCAARRRSKKRPLHPVTPTGWPRRR